jgi:hypothetical protein
VLRERLSQPTFHQHAADLNTLRSAIKVCARDAASAMAGAQRQTLAEAAQDLQRLPAWSELTQEEQSQTLARLDDLAIQATPDLQGIKRLLNQSLVVQARLSALKREVDELGHQRQVVRQRTATPQPIRDRRIVVAVPARLLTLDELEDLISRLQIIKSQLAGLSEIEVTLEVISQQ